MSRNRSGDQNPNVSRQDNPSVRQAGHTLSIESRVKNSEVLDLEGMLRIPWNIEVKTSDASMTGASGAGGLGLGRKASQQASQSKNTEYLRIDPYLDTSDLAMSSSGGVVSDMNRFVKVRGVVLGPDGCPQGERDSP